MTGVGIVPAGPSPFDAIRHVDRYGEHWFARELMPLLQYINWRDFAEAIGRAQAALEANGERSDDHIADARNMVQIGSGAQRAVQDFRMTRYGAYAVVQASDARKPRVAQAWAYFRVKTREAEAHLLGDPLDELERQAVRTSQAVQIARRERDARIAAEERVLELEPAARAWDTLASGRGDLSVADAAKILSNDPAIKLGRDRLFELLNGYGWAFRQRGDNRWRARQTAIECRRLAEMPSSHRNPKTDELVIDAPKVRVTIKGLREIHKRLGGVAPLNYGDLDLRETA